MPYLKPPLRPLSARIALDLPRALAAHAIPRAHAVQAALPTYTLGDGARCVRGHDPVFWVATCRCVGCSPAFEPYVAIDTPVQAPTRPAEPSIEAPAPQALTDLLRAPGMPWHRPSRNWVDPAKQARLIPWD